MKWTMNQTLCGDFMPQRVWVPPSRQHLGSLMESLSPGWMKDHHHTFMAGRVSYVDYDKEDIPVLHGMPLFYKRKSFSHEKEVRVSCSRTSTNPAMEEPGT